MHIPNKTLIIRFSSIGDIILASPLLRVLRRKFPSSQIDFATRKEFAELIKYNPNLNHVYELDALNGNKELLRLKKVTNENKYDLIVDIHNSIRSRIIRLLNKAKEIVVIDKRIWARTMLVKFKRNYYRDNISIADRYIEPLEVLGIKNDNEGLELFIPEEILAKVASRMNEMELNNYKKVIGFCPSAKHVTKCWPKERYIDAGIRLSDEYSAKILIFGGPLDFDKNRSIAESINASKNKKCAEDFECRLSLLETAAAMHYCDVIVTNDTGLMHMGAAVKRKIVAVIGSTVKEFGFFPTDKSSIVLEVKGLYCRPCSHIGRSSCPEKHFRCMNEIQVADVLNSIRKIMQDN
jgi:lipopolysaccharide heptosyltransferase II